MDRRSFVRQGSTLLALSGAAPLFAAEAQVNTGTVHGGKVEFPPIAASTESEGKPPNPAPADQRVGFAVVGLGRLAVEEILPAFARAKHARLVALVSGTADKAQALAAQYGVASKHIYDYRSFESMQDNPEIQAVYIVLPNSMHCEYTVRAAATAKHVLCEKPMAVSPAECEQMIAACAKADRKLMIAYRMQYEPYTRELIWMTRAGEFGKLTTITSVHNQNQGTPKQWRLQKKMAGGGSLYDIGIYSQNAARYVTGEEPVEVSARIFSTPGDSRFKEVEETVSWTLRFPSGCIATLSTSYGAHKKATLSVNGAEAVAVMDPAFPYQGQQLKVSKKVSDRFQNETQWKTTPKDQFALELDHMAQCIKNNVRPHTPGEEGLADQRVMEAVYKSAATGRVVDLPRIEGLDTTRGPAPEQD